MTIFLFYFLFLFFRFAPYIIFDFVRYMLICSVCSYFHIFFGFNLVLLKSNLMSNISVYNLIWRISSKLLQYVYIFHCEIDLLFLRNIFFFLIVWCALVHFNSWKGQYLSSFDVDFLHIAFLRVGRFEEKFHGRFASFIMVMLSKWKWYINWFFYIK